MGYVYMVLTITLREKLSVIVNSPLFQSGHLALSNPLQNLDFCKAGEFVLISGIAAF